MGDVLFYGYITNLSVSLFVYMYVCAFYVSLFVNYFHGQFAPVLIYVIYKKVFGQKMIYINITFDNPTYRVKSLLSEISATWKI